MNTAYTAANVSSQRRNDFALSTILVFGQKAQTAHHSQFELFVELSGLTPPLLPVLVESLDPPPPAGLGGSFGLMLLAQTTPINDETLTTEDLISLSPSLLSVGDCTDRLPRPLRTIGV